MSEKVYSDYIVDDSVLWKTVVLDLPELLKNLRKIY